MSLPSRLLGANPSIQVSALLSGTLTTPSAKGAFVYPIDAYESIETVTLTGTQSTVSFTSIPTTFKHLQVRWIGRGSFNGLSAGQKVNFNSDTGNNYSGHLWRGDGTTDFADQGSTIPAANFLPRIACATSQANIFGAFIMDILDYSNTNKYKTVTCIGGNDQSNTGEQDTRVASQVWRSNSAITSMVFQPTDGGGYVQYTKFALYGIKG